MNLLSIRCGLGMMILVLTVSAAAQEARPGPGGRGGYLSAAETPDVAKIVQPAPQEGDARFIADMAIFHQTRALEGSPRWALALADDNVTTAGLFHAYRCALGLTLTAESAPKTWALVVRATADAGSAAGKLKNLYQHKRPFQVSDGRLCVSAQGKAGLESNPDYPSGHATASWEAALVLSEAAPGIATGLLSRARAFGESRVVCGVHNASAIDAAWATATAIFAAQNTSPAFRADVDAARSELAGLRSGAPALPEHCAEETAILAARPY